MKCFYHPTEDAVAQCVKCMKGLCKECATVYDPPCCPSCAAREEKEFHESIQRTAENMKFIERVEFWDDLKEYILVLVISGVLALITYNICNYAYSGVSSIKSVIYTLFAICVPFGIMALHKGRGGAILLCIPILGWLLYLPLAILIGIFSLIISTIKLNVKGISCFSK